MGTTLVGAHRLRIGRCAQRLSGGAPRPRPRWWRRLCSGCEGACMRPFSGEVTPALDAQVAEAWMSVLGPGRRDRRRHLSVPAGEGRRGLRADRPGVPGRRPLEHPRPHPARHRGDGRASTTPRTAPPSCGARPGAAGRGRASRWRWCSTPTRSAPACSGRRCSRRAPATTSTSRCSSSPASRSGRRWTCRTPSSSRPTGARACGCTDVTCSASRAPSTRSSRVVARTPDFAAEAREVLGDRRRADGRVRRRAVRRVAGGAARSARGPARAAGDRLALARARRSLLRAARRRAARRRTGWSSCCGRTRPAGRTGRGARGRRRLRDRLPAGVPGRRHRAAGVSRTWWR